MEGRRAGGQEASLCPGFSMSRIAHVPPHTPACGPVCRRVINPLEASDIVGITNYVDIGVQVWWVSRWMDSHVSGRRCWPGYRSSSCVLSSRLLAGCIIDRGSPMPPPADRVTRSSIIYADGDPDRRLPTAAAGGDSECQ